jgi:hypothetical protein
VGEYLQECIEEAVMRESVFGYLSTEDKDHFYRSTRQANWDDESDSQHVLYQVESFEKTQSGREITYRDYG